MINRHFIHQALGFSLVELMGSLAVGTLLVCGAAPAFDGLVAKSRMSAQINELISHLHLARSEAIKRYAPAVLCPSANGSTCHDQPEWHRGYILFADKNNNGQRDAGEELLRVRQGETASLTALSSLYRKRVIYRANGLSGGANITVTFCDSKKSTPPKAVIVSNTGRPRVSDTTADGGALTCT